MARKITIDEIFYKKCGNCKKEIPCISTARVKGFFCASLKMRLGSIRQKYCSKKCSIYYKNTYQNPAKTESARKKISEKAKKRPIDHLMTPEVRKKQRESISGSGHWNWQGGISHPKCLDCGKKITFKKKRCTKCYAKYMLGPNSPNWKGGVSPINKRIRESSEGKRWRKSIFERDNYTCLICLKRGGLLNADHIKPFSMFPELRFELSNGRTLCVDCHKKTDTFGSKIHSYKKSLSGN